MSTTVTYKGNTLTTVSNVTKTLKTAGKYMEGDVTLVDDSKPTYTDVENSSSGRTITVNDGVMATGSKTVRLVPTKFYRIREYTNVSNESNAFTNTDSDTYATVVNESNYSRRVYVGGFDFSQIPAYASVTSYSVKFKISADGASEGGTFTALYNGTSSISGQKAMSYKLYTTPEISSGDNLIPWADLLVAGDDFNISIPHKEPGTSYIYGVEIEVTYDLPVNKVVYGTTVLVDLTEDTVTPNDLSEGVTAHDKSGGLITGTNSRGIMVIRDSSDSHGGTVRTITSGEAQVGGMTEADLKLFISRNSNFKDIDWPDGMTRIGDYAFAGCSNFNPSSLPSGLTSIGSHAFDGCSNLTITELPNGLTSMGSYAFAGCSNFNPSSLPSGLTSIDSSVFYGCSKLAITELPSGLTRINSNAFTNCKSLAITEIPSGVTALSSNAFVGCTSLQEISSEGTITSASYPVFTGNNTNPTMQLKSASFPNMALTSNINYVFGNTSAAYACQQLAFCDIGSTTGIAENAFANCYALQTLVLRKTASICTLANISAFLNTPMRGYNSLTGTVYVPQALIESYKTATNWSTLYNNGTVTFAAIEGSKYEREVA